MASAYTIQQVAVMTGLSAHTLRYYERAGLILSVSRAPSGHRQYSDQDIEWIGFLKCLRSAGMPVREIRRYAELLRRGSTTVRDRIALLEAHRDRIEGELRILQASLEVIQWKIAHYKEVEAQFQHELHRS